MARALVLVAKELETFKVFPPRQKPDNFSIGHAIEKLPAGLRFVPAPAKRPIG